jgi:hypothetical protein
MFGAVMGFITGGPVGALLGIAKDFMGPLANIFKQIQDTKIALAQAANESEKNRLTAHLGALQVQAQNLQTQANLQAEESHSTRLNIMIRSWIAAGPAFLLTKIYIYDKALGQWTGGHTDALDPNLWNVVMVVLGFYFLHETVGLFRK